MPVYIDILENEILGPAFRSGLEKGLEEGKAEGKLEGKLEGELQILRRLIERRFGPVPEWANDQLAARPVGELEELSVRVLDAISIEDLLR
jgi:predicted transposase YdaD